MKCTVLTVLLLCSWCSAQTCLIVKHASVSRQVWVSGANWQYVAGDFPQGMKWKSNVTDRTIRKVKELGGRVITIQDKYTPSELEQAKAECSVSAKEAVK